MRRSFPLAVFAALLVGASEHAAGQDGAATPMVLAGTVVEETSRLPIPGANVRLVDDQGAQRATTITDERGRFRLNIQAPGRYVVRADRIGFRRGPSAEVVVGTRMPPPVVLTMAQQAVLLDSMLTTEARGVPEPAPGRTQQLIVGHLRDDDTGLPVEGGKIDLLDERNHNVGTKVSDQAGRFRLITPNPGRFSLIAQRPGYQSARQDSIRLRLGDTILVDFRISRRAPILAPMLITASTKPMTGRRDSEAQDELYERMHFYGNNRFASYITRDSIEDYDDRGYMTAQILPRFIKQQAPPDSFVCHDTAYFVNGLPWERQSFDETAHMSPQEAFELRSIDLIEVYIYPAIPSAFSTPVWKPPPVGQAPRTMMKKPCIVISVWRREKWK